MQINHIQLTSATNNAQAKKLDDVSEINSMTPESTYVQINDELSENLTLLYDDYLNAEENIIDTIQENLCDSIQ